MIKHKREEGGNTRDEEFDWLQNRFRTSSGENFEEIRQRGFCRIELHISPPLCSTLTMHLRHRGMAKRLLTAQKEEEYDELQPHFYGDERRNNHRYRVRWYGVNHSARGVNQPTKDKN
jgi:hypothetical protein